MLFTRDRHAVGICLAGLIRSWGHCQACLKQWFDDSGPRVVWCVFRLSAATLNFRCVLLLAASGEPGAESTPGCLVSPSIAGFTV